MTRRRDRMDQNHGIPLQAVPPIKPFRDKVIRTTIVPCPTCNAPVGATCVASTGSRVVHPTRRGMALRALREMQEEGDE